MATPSDKKLPALHSFKEQASGKSNNEFNQGIERIFILRGSVFLVGVAGMAMLSGFGLTIARAKRASPTQFTKGILSNQAAELHESGATLAVKALGWGSLFAVTGVGVLLYGACKILGVHSTQEFKEKFQSVAPPIRRNSSNSTDDELAELKLDIFGDESPR